MDRTTDGAQARDNDERISPPPRPGSSTLSLLRRGVLIIGFLLAALILAGSILAVNKLRQQTVANAARDLTTLSGMTAERTSQALVSVDLVLKSVVGLAVRPSLSGPAELQSRAVTRQFFDSLVRLQALLPELQSVSVSDVDGNVLANSHDFPMFALNLSQAPFFRALRENPKIGLMISDPVLNPLTGKWMLYLARPIVDDKEGFAGLALVGVPTSYFEGYFSTIDMGPESAVSLSNHALKLIARWPRIDSLIGKPLPNYIPELERDPDGKTLAVLEGADGLDRLIAITRFDVQGQQLFLGVAQTWGAILQPWRDSLVWVVLFALLSLMVLIALTWFVFRAVNSERRWTRALIERETRLIKQARELSRARDAAEGANRVRAQFLANMSHELRTPLNAVLGFTEIIDQEMLGPIGAGYKEFTQDILASGRRLLEIINNILDLTRLDAGTLELEEQEVDISDIMRLSARLSEEPAEKAGLTLNASRPAQEIMMMGDPLRLKQILLNVLTNAITFTPAGGRITFSGSLVEEGFLIQIADTGIGMTEEEAARAMQRFGQVDGSLARQHEGAGLGLPIAKSLAELHGGRLTMKSAPGQGTIVTLLLPKRRLIQSRSNSAEQAAGSQAMPTGFARAI